MTKDPRVDAYIKARAEFARPILEHLRAAVHTACPEAEETLKWSMPAFLYKGKILAGMAAFKAHASFSFWDSKEVTGLAHGEREGMGSFGRIQSIGDLPDDAALAAMIRKAMAMIDAGAREKAAPKQSKPAVQAPEDFASALAAEPAAKAVFDAFPPSAQREYVDWVVEAKRAETRASRIAQAVAWLAEGKRRHWKYEKC